MASYTVRNVSGTCQAFKIEGGTETMICAEGQKVSKGSSTYTVKKEGGKCCIFEIARLDSGGSVREHLVKKCTEGQTI